jgi:hypothetical protein
VNSHEKKLYIALLAARDVLSSESAAQLTPTEQIDMSRTLIDDAIRAHVDSPATPEQVEAARDKASQFGDGNDVEIEDDASVSKSDEESYWVSGWVWVCSEKGDENEPA